MVNQISVIASKDLLYRSVPLVFTLLFFMQIAPFKELYFMRNVEPVLLWSGTLLLIDGFVMLVEFFRNLPDTGNHLGAKSGAYIFLVMGLIAFVFGIASLTGLYDPLADMSPSVANTTLTILLGLSTIILYASVHPSIFHQKRNLAHLLRG